MLQLTTDFGCDNNDNASNKCQISWLKLAITSGLSLNIKCWLHHTILNNSKYVSGKKKTIPEKHDKPELNKRQSQIL